MSAAIELDRVNKVYDGAVAALHEVSLTVHYGEFVGVVGPSGSGKSTMLHIIGTLDRPSSGRVFVAGHDVATLTDRELSAFRAHLIGFVFQEFHLTPSASALSNVADGLLYTGLPNRERVERARIALERVGLADRMRHRPAELSGGERQRVAIARAVCGRPPLVLADEPTGNLDSATGAGIMALLSELNHDGTTILVITHDRQIADALPRRVWMRDGRVLTDEAP